MTGWRNVWSMKLRVQDQGEDQRRPGKRLYVRTVKHVSWIKRMPWTVTNGERWYRKHDDPDGCEWVNVSSGTGLPGLSRIKGRWTVVVVVLQQLVWFYRSFQNSFWKYVQPVNKKFARDANKNEHMKQKPWRLCYYSDNLARGHMPYFDNKLSSSDSEHKTNCKEAGSKYSIQEAISALHRYSDIMCTHTSIRFCLTADSLSGLAQNVYSNSTAPTTSYTFWMAARSCTMRDTNSRNVPGSRPFAILTPTRSFVRLSATTYSNSNKI